MSTTRRIIEPKMIEYFDNKLIYNGLAQHAIQNKIPRQLMVEAAKTCVGIREKTGHNDGPMVELIQETVGGHSREAWCMAFVMTCLAYAEVKTGIKSPIPASESCWHVWEHAPVEMRVKRFPLAGAIILWGHYNSKGAYTGGHTGILLDCDEDSFHAVEGNTTSGSDSPDGKVEREGGGCYFTHRLRAGNGDMKVRGYLKPF